MVIRCSISASEAATERRSRTRTWASSLRVLTQGRRPDPTRHGGRRLGGDRQFCATWDQVAEHRMQLVGDTSPVCGKVWTAFPKQREHGRVIFAAHWCAGALECRHARCRRRRRSRGLAEASSRQLPYSCRVGRRHVDHVLASGDQPSLPDQQPTQCTTPCAGPPMIMILLPSVFPLCSETTIGMPTSSPTRADSSVWSQTAAGRRPGGEPWDSQPQGGMRFTSQPDQRPKTPRDITRHDRHPIDKSAVQPVARKERHPGVRSSRTSPMR